MKTRPSNSISSRIAVWVMARFAPNGHLIRKLTPPLLLVLCVIHFSTPTSFAGDEELYDQIKAEIVLAISGSAYKENFKLGTDGMKGVFPCDVHNTAIQRLRQRTDEADLDGVVEGFFIEWVKAMSSILSAF